jgi:conjugal transfer mating pair stabilization protein TraN
MVSETCTRSVNGLCDSWDREYRCWNGPADSVGADLLSRQYRNFAETVTSDCAALQGDTSCSFVETVTLQGAGSRIINEYPINRLWWEREQRFSCAGVGPVDTCGPIQSDPVCKENADPVCTSFASDGSCEVWRRSFHCYADPSLNAACQEINICEGENCTGAPEEPDEEYANAAAWLNFLDQAARQNTCDADPGLEEGAPVTDLGLCATGQLDYTEPQVFGGENRWCSYTNFYNCCKGDDNLGRCSDHELETAQARQVGATHYRRTTCSRTIVFGTICVERRRYYCVYDSKFARVFQEQANVQTGGQFSSNCPGLTIAQLETIDVGIMDLSEVFGDMLDSVALPIQELVMERLAEDMGLLQTDVGETFGNEP